MRIYLPAKLARAEQPPSPVFTNYQPAGKPLPAEVDLSHFYGPIEDQGNLGSCTAFASLQWFSALRVMAGYSWVEYSELADYWEERLMLNSVNEDSGATTVTAIKVLEMFGAMLESDFNYDPSKFTQAPPDKWDATIKLTAQQAQLIPQGDNFVQNTKDALANGHPVLFGMVVFNGLESAEVAQNGMLSMPVLGESPVGGHEVQAVGYSDALGGFIVRNQWGADWGWPKKKGHFIMPYPYFEQYVMDEAVAGFAPSQKAS